MSEVLSAASDEVYLTIAGEDYVPDDVLSLGVSINGAVLTLAWSEVEFADAYAVRYSPLISGAVWEAMTELARPTATTHPTQLRNGTFAVKAMGAGGVLSANAAFTVVAGAEVYGLNVIQTVSETGAWAGPKSNTTKDGDILRLSLGGNLFSAPDLFVLSNLFEPGGPVTYAGSGTYQFPQVVDLGEVYTSRVTPSIWATGLKKGFNLFDAPNLFALPSLFGYDAGDWNARLQYSATNDNPAFGHWGAWLDLALQDITARAMRFRLLLESFSPGVSPRVTRASVTIDMPDRDERGKDIVIPAGGLVVTFAKPFKDTPAIAPAVQNMASGDRFAITAKSPHGFTIQVFNASGAGFSRTFDWIAKGYGRRQ